LGIIKCRICDAKYQCVTDNLSDPIDVYSEWIDECSKANAEDQDDVASDEEEVDDE
jgi:transcription elongation factor Elf1